MSGQTAGLSIYTLPLFLRNLRGLQLAEKSHKRAFSTTCCFGDIPPTSQRNRYRCYVPYKRSSDATLKTLAGSYARSPSHRYLSTSTGTRKPSHSQSSATRRRAKTKDNPKKTDSRKRETDNSASDKPAHTVPAKSTKKREPWMVQKQALKEKFKGDWEPRKKLSPDAMDGVRHLHKMDPTRFSTPVLAEYFKVSPEAIRRILKSKWRPTEEDIEHRRERWEKREARIWNQMSELGLRPQRKAFAPLSDVQNLKGPDDAPKDNEK